ncbi:MAG: tetraacyldisaccharide 4'-kinase [Myxococcota bacterium]
MSERLERLWYPEAEEGFWRQTALAPLAAASLVFRAALGARNALYERGVLAARRVEGARVVSVGNLNVGGAGKTPAVIHLANLALAQKLRVAVLSRGYGRVEKEAQVVGPHSNAASVGDEPLLIARRCPGAVVWVGADRWALAQRAREEHGAQLLLLDDGLQHRRLARDADVVVIDETVGFGNGRLMPRGPLREPVEALKRASLVWLKVAEGSAAVLPELSVPVVRAVHRPSVLIDPQGQEHSPKILEGRRVLALVGLARPTSFVRTLKRLGARLAAVRAFGDHHVFTPAELAEARTVAHADGAEVVTTEKDWMRLPRDFPAWVVRLDVEVVSGADALMQLLAL